MKLSALNEWLTLVANVGVLIGIFVVAVQLRQTQTEMRAETSTTRSQISVQNSNMSLDLGISKIREKVIDGQNISEDEAESAQKFHNNLLRYFENLHYQNHIGVLDEEIWQANLNAISSLCRDPLFSYVVPDWKDSVAASTFRASFVELVTMPCDI